VETSLVGKPSAAGELSDLKLIGYAMGARGRLIQRAGSSSGPGVRKRGSMVSPPNRQVLPRCPPDPTASRITDPACPASTARALRA